MCRKKFLHKKYFNTAYNFSFVDFQFEVWASPTLLDALLMYVYMLSIYIKSRIYHSSLQLNLRSIIGWTFKNAFLTFQTIYPSPTDVSCILIGWAGSCAPYVRAWESWGKNGWKYENWILQNCIFRLWTGQIIRIQLKTTERKKYVSVFKKRPNILIFHFSILNISPYSASIT